jgi:PAS domain S-box-containing protein
MKNNIDDIYKYLKEADNDTVSAKKVMEYLDKIKSNDKEAEDKCWFSEFLESISTLNNIQEFSKFFCNYLYNLFDNKHALVIVSFFSAQNSEFNAESVCGCPELTQSLEQLVENNILSLSLRNRINCCNKKHSSHLIEIDSLHNFVFRTISKEQCAKLESEYNLHNFYSYPIPADGKTIAIISMALSDELDDIIRKKIEQVLMIVKQHIVLFYKNQSLVQLNKHYSSIFDAADFAFCLFDNYGKLINANASFKSIFNSLGDFGLFTPKFTDVLGITDISILTEGNEITLNDSNFDINKTPILSEYSKGRITPIKTTDAVISHYLFFLHSRKAELKIFEMIKSSEQKYERIFNHIQDVYFEIKLDGTILEISPSVYHFSQYKPKDLIGKNIMSFYNEPEKRDKYIGEINKHGVVRNLEIDVMSSDNKTYSTIVTSSIIDAGTPNERIVGSMTDVTELKKKTQAVIDNEIKFKSIFDNAPLGFMICDLEGYVKELNIAFLKMFNLSYFEKGKRINIHESKLLFDYNISDVLNEVLRTGKPVFTEFNHTITEGNVAYFKLKISIIPDETGSPKLVLIIAEDITEIKAKDQELEVSRERFLDIYNNTNDLIFTVDFNGYFTSVNPVAKKWFGVRFDNLKNKNISEFVTHDSAKRAMEQIKLKLNKATMQSTYEVTAVNFKNEVVTLEVNSFLRYKNDNPLEVFGIARDITERKKHEEFITVSLREREHLIMEVHHRVKNNMQLVISMIKMYSYEYKDHKILQTFNDIMQKILAIAVAYEDFYFSANFKEIDIETYIRSIVTNLISQYDKNNKVLYKIESDKMHASIDEVVPIGLILSELVSNSIRYGAGQDGMVKLEISFCKAGEKYELLVKDYGLGISPEITNNIDKSLGLSLVKMMAENQLMGKFSIESGERGTEVRIEI